jgi:hypothetical protein
MGMLTCQIERLRQLYALKSIAAGSESGINKDFFASAMLAAAAWLVNGLKEEYEKVDA